MHTHKLSLSWTWISIHSWILMSFKTVMNLGTGILVLQQSQGAQLWYNFRDSGRSSLVSRIITKHIELGFYQFQEKHAATSSSLFNQSSCCQSIISHCCFNWRRISNESNFLQTNPMSCKPMVFWRCHTLYNAKVPEVLLSSQKLSLWFSANIMAESSLCFWKCDWNN